MRGPVVSALVRDAFYQVLDNQVFRILALLALLPVAVTFVLGFREDELVLLFGLRSWSYGELLGFFDGPRAGGEGVRELAIAAFLDIVFDYVAGSFGVIFCIVATAFFVPRMLERGAAEVLFHKPVSRFSFYLARYLAGLFFIGLLALLMATGMYLGLLIVSGWHDLTVLLSGAVLTYVFALVYPVSMLVGVVTRSTAAAVLLTFVFFAFNGCVHRTWIPMHMSDEAGEPAPQTGDADPAVEVEGEGTPAVLRALKRTIEVLHVVLPKTTDASYLVDRARPADRMGPAPRPDDYGARLTFRADWRTNILFSVGSSLTFVALVLALGWWRLARIEF